MRELNNLTHESNGQQDVLRVAAGGFDRAQMRAVIKAQQPAVIKRLKEWVALPSIAAENLNMKEGAEMLCDLLTEAGFQYTKVLPTDGAPGVFATFDAGSPRTVGVYFLYDVKQFDPAEWSSPPLVGEIVEKPDLGKVMIGRGAWNSKGPQMAFLAALHALRAAGLNPPVNLVLVADGEEEICSPHFPQIVGDSEVVAALSKCKEIFLPWPAQSPEGDVEILLGTKGWVELELTASTERWGRGAKDDIHSSHKAELDSAVWHLVKALNTLVSEDGNDPAIDDWFENVVPLTERQKELVSKKVATTSEGDVKNRFGVQCWVRDLSYYDAMERLASKPTVNIQGLIAGYTGPGGNTVLPNKATAKLDLRLVPNQTGEEAVVKIKAHLAKRGFGDVEVKSITLDPHEIDEDSTLIKAAIATYESEGLLVNLWPRSGGSWPGAIFSRPPISLAAGGFGTGHGGRAHAPDEYYVIEAINPKLRGMAESTLSYISFLFALAET
ncbi:M20/M25/M40 family metallo-hydrolase [Bradyrhizobium sp. NAS96.2]|uniref:M20/M25/M40 family metallo-hydrolase n=1 Tax=Bradyrhizobium sp. NAS96.2 TaxID=1680160 RepID=UPI001160ED18|nr:M20/M25/M40 family metallo-hydrolase [Bradyrhizobium sp. NAS96.2]